MTSGKDTYEISSSNNNVIIEGVQDLYGNRIGHNPLLPKKFIAPKENRRPESIRDVVEMFNNVSLESQLSCLFYYHLDCQNKIKRFMRSEFREMISIGCAILTHCYDVMTGEIGYKNDKGKWVRISYQQLAKDLNVSLSRVKRFFKFLLARKLVNVKWDYQPKIRDGKKIWRSNIARKFLKPAFFIETLGIKAWRKLEGLKAWKIKNAKPKTKDQAQNASMLKSLFKSTANVCKNFTKKKNPSPLQPSNPDKERNMISMAMDLFKKDPSRSISQYLIEIKSHSS